MTNKVKKIKVKKPKAKPKTKTHKKQKQKQKQNQNVKININGGGGSQGTSIIQVPQYIEVPKYINQNSTQDSNLVNQLVDEIRNFEKKMTTNKPQQQQPEIIKEDNKPNEPVVKKRTRGKAKPKIHAIAVHEQIQNAIREQENAFNVSDSNEQGERIQSLYKEKGDFIGVNPSTKKGDFINNNTFIQKDLKAQAKLYKVELDKQKKDNKTQKITKKQETINQMNEINNMRMEDNNKTKIQYQQEQIGKINNTIKTQNKNIKKAEKELNII